MWTGSRKECRAKTDGRDITKQKSPRGILCLYKEHSLSQQDNIVGNDKLTHVALGHNPKKVLKRGGRGEGRRQKKRKKERKQKKVKK